MLFCEHVFDFFEIDKDSNVTPNLHAAVQKLLTSIALQMYVSKTYKNIFSHVHVRES